MPTLASFAGLVLLVLAVAGCDTTAVPTPGVRLPLDRIEAVALPDPEGALQRDLFVEIQNSVGQSLWRSNRILGDVRNQATFPAASFVEVPSASTPLRVVVYAFRTTLTDALEVGQSVPFTAAEFIATTQLTVPATGGGTFLLYQAGTAP